jgi:predicted nucleic acid-binding protein
LVALLVDEPDSDRRALQLREDPVLAVWWSTPVECESAIQRRLRDGALDDAGARTARERLVELAGAWHEAPPAPALRTLATRLLRTHPLRAADALQLAAALSLAGALHRPIGFVCADDRLCAAAEVEGLPLLP